MRNAISSASISPACSPRSPGEERGPDPHRDGYSVVFHAGLTRDPVRARAVSMRHASLILRGTSEPLGGGICLGLRWPRESGLSSSVERGAGCAARACAGLPTRAIGSSHRRPNFSSSGARAERPVALKRLPKRYRVQNGARTVGDVDRLAGMRLGGPKSFTKQLQNNPGSFSASVRQRSQSSPSTSRNTSPLLAICRKNRPMIEWIS